MPLYKHKALDQTKREFRLLKFRRIENNIHCKISVQEMVNSPSYRALSYAWGSLAPTFDIFIHHRRYPVSENLFTFLQCLTMRKPAMNYFWIDQISINQSDISERNHQVRLMAEIYKGADFVTIWLGDAIEHYNTTPGLSNSQIPALSVYRLGTLLRDPYFTRLWIVQECLLARNIEIVIPGAGHVDWDEIHDLICYYPEETLLRSILIPQSILSLFRERRRGKSLTLASCIASFCSNECADVKDKVYGFMGIVDDTQNIQIDYGKSLPEVCSDVAIAFYRSCPGELDTLSSKEYLEILLRLCKHFDFSYDQAKALRIMMEEIWHLPRPYSYDKQTRQRIYRRHPVTSMGYEDGMKSKVCEFRSGKELRREMLLDRWWYKICKWQYFPAIPRIVRDRKTFQVPNLVVQSNQCEDSECDHEDDMIMNELYGMAVIR